MRLKKLISFVLVLSLMFSFSAAAFAAPAAGKKTEKANRSIVLDTENLTLYVGKYADVKAEVKVISETAPEKTNLVWSSSDEKVATVSETGRVYAASKGSAVISCRAEDDGKIAAQVKVDVLVPVERLTLEKDSMELVISDFDKKAGTGKLNVTVEPEDASVRDVEWSTGDEKVAVVDEKGNVTAVGVGRTSITVTSKDKAYVNPVSTYFNVTVSKAASSIECDKTDITVIKGYSATINAIVLEEDTTNKNLIWESEDESVAAVSYNGSITGIACGTTTVKCTSESTPEVFAECKVTVIQPVTALRNEFAGKTVELAVGESMNFEVTVEPEDATDKKLVWESSDESIVTVDAKGGIKAVSCGDAEISCKAADGSEKSVSFKVHVPSIKTDRSEYIITEKEGIRAKVVYYGEPGNVDIVASDSKFYMHIESIRKTEDGGTEYDLWFDPHTAGSSVFDVLDNADPTNSVRIPVEVKTSATYDCDEYPMLKYQKVAEKPVDYYGEQVSIYGRVLQAGDGFLRVGVGGYGYFRDPVFVLLPDDYNGPKLEYEDMVTVFGVCVGNETYTSVLLQNITIPAMVAEKVIIRITKWDN